MVTKLRVSQERTFLAHHMLLDAARKALKGADRKKPGWFFACLTAMTMCALAVEALANAFGERVVEDWDDFETSKPVAKLRLICKELGVPFSREDKPWSTAIWLAKFRNQIAHAKPEIITANHVWTEDEYEKNQFVRPNSKLEAMVTLGNAKQSLESLEAIKALFCKKISADKSFGLYSDMWMSSATSAGEQ